MDAQLDDDDYFGDDLEQLPANALHRLERDAVTLSQQAPRSLEHRGQPSITSAGSRDARSVGTSGYKGQHDGSGFPNGSFPHPPSSDYGLDDEDVIDLDDSFTYAAGQPSLQPAQTAAVHEQYGAMAAQAGLQEGRWYQQTHSADQQSHTAQRGSASIADMADLQARIRELETERVNLQRSVEDAVTDAQSKAGAISILRANNDKAAKEYERKLSVMQKLHAEEVAKSKAQLEDARKERETVKTNNRFLEHDLAQEVERAKRVKSTSHTVANGNGLKATQRKAGGESTPRKNKTLADGFDDNEIMMVSSSKSKERDKEKTPKAGGKRKRAVEASPIPLVIRQPTASPPALPPHPSMPAQVDEVLIRRLAQSNSTIQTMQRVLNHSPGVGHRRTIEALVKYSFPDHPAISLSSLLLQELAMMSARDDASASVQVCRICMRLWEKCLSHKFLDPLYPLLDLFEFIMLLMPNELQVALTPQVVPLAVKSVDIVAVPLARAVRNAGSAVPGKATRIGDTKQNMPDLPTVDVDLVLSILHRVAMSASRRPESARGFWERMEFDFVLLMLNKAQPLPQIRLMLQMVSVSALSDCFGTIHSDPDRQKEKEAGILDRMTSLLFETPNPPPYEEPYTNAEIAALRVEIIRTLRALCLTDHASVTIAQHRTVIGRLIRFLDGQVTSLYAISPLSALSGGAAHPPSDHDLVIASINLTVRLLHHLLHTHTDLINLREKLAVIHGGHQKFLVSFSRLAFSEQLVFEAGLEEGVVDAAHEILDGVLGPEEGEAVLQAVETPRGTTASRMSLPAASAPR